MSDLEAAFLTYWKQLAPGAPAPEREYRWAAHWVGLGPGLRKALAVRGLRDWRFDFAWPNSLVDGGPEGGVAVEMHGGTWAGGRHTRGAGFRDDREKMNAAVLRGWTVIELTADMLADDPARWIEAIVAAVTSGASREEVGG